MCSVELHINPFAGGDDPRVGGGGRTGGGSVGGLGDLDGARNLRETVDVVVQRQRELAVARLVDVHPRELEFAAVFVAAVAVTAIGLTLPPITIPESIRQSTNMLTVTFSYPPLFKAIAWAMGENLVYAEGKAVNPMVMGGWIGMFVTVLNLLPVGQLDGGHMMRALIGPRQERLSMLVPLAPFAVAAYVYVATNATDSVGIWVLWGFIATLMVRAGPVTPISEERLDRKRIALGVVTFVLGILCFTPIPIAISA